MFADVVLDIANSNVDKTFEYIIPENTKIVPGMRVSVPFGNTKKNGFVIKIKQNNEFESDKLKHIDSVIDEKPVLTEEQIRLAYYIEAQYHTTLTYALRFMIPAALRRGAVKTKSRNMVRLKNSDPISIMALKESCISKDGKIKYKARAEAIEKLIEGDLPLSEISKSVLDYLKKEDAIEILSEEVLRRPKSIEIPDNDFELNEEQDNAVKRINAAIDGGKQKTMLLHGVTGSGKTEVYLRAAQHAIDNGKTVIMLVPEISLTPQLSAVFRARFGDKIAVFHSGLSIGERYDEWKKSIRGDVKIVLGVRSAVFAPLENVGLIIIDEEHERSYKADNYPQYHAFEIANMRSRMNDCVLLLGSATPQIETYLKAQLGIYELIELKNRIKELPLPDIEVVDMRREFHNGNPGMISGKLYKELKNCLAKGNQALLFINRRGYASSVQCKSCGHVIMCDHCDIPMKYHYSDNSLKCHYCGKTVPYKNICPNCGEPFLQNRGVGTEQVEEQIKRLFPSARILRMDYDSTRKKNAYEELYSRFKNNEADIMIGTQMIARGLDFDNVTLAAIISADSMANYEDYRADERMFSMIEQVGGRAGRKSRGKVIIQTFDTDNYVIKCAQNHDYAGFYNSEIERRKTIEMPPYSRLYRFVFSHKEAEKAEEAMRDAESRLKEILKDYEEDISFFVAKAAPVEKLQDRFRYNILIKVKNTRTASPLKKQLFDLWEDIRKGIVEVTIDVNPYETI